MAHFNSKLIGLLVFGVLSQPEPAWASRASLNSYFCKSVSGSSPYMVELDTVTRCERNGNESSNVFTGVCHQRVECTYVSDAAKEVVISRVEGSRVSFDSIPLVTRETLLTAIELEQRRTDGSLHGSELEWHPGVATCKAVEVSGRKSCPHPDQCKMDGDFQSRNSDNVVLPNVVGRMGAPVPRLDNSRGAGNAH